MFRKFKCPVRWVQLNQTESDKVFGLMQVKEVNINHFHEQPTNLPIAKKQFDFTIKELKDTFTENLETMG